MNIVMVGSGVVSIPPKRGGATELIIYEIARFLPKKKFNVFVVDKKWDNSDEEKIDGVSYRRCSVPGFSNIFLMRIAELIFGLKSVRKIRQINAEQRIDIIHAHTVFSALPLALLKKFLPGKLIYTCHNPAWSDDADVLNSLIMKIEGYVMRKCDYVTTVSDVMRSRIIKNAGIKGENISRIYNFVDTRSFSPKLGRSWKNERGIDKCVFFVSKLSPNKGVECLIRSAAIVREKVPGVKYVIAGPVSFEYEKKNPWEKIVNDLDLDETVMFTGALERGELARAYASADLFCFPTLKESFGMVIVEAMASGLPVITTDMPVTKEVTSRNAILVRKNDHDGVANAVIKLLEDRQLRNRMKKLSVKRSKDFEIQKIMEQYENMYSHFSRL
ncbi:glycosyltransferase family 4 protein [Candidatus Woesearchaeota archaeon]|nr:glycosyltransferase family 4 protein [Candidatus Woesearchaeota archaeon]